MADIVKLPSNNPLVARLREIAEHIESDGIGGDSLVIAIEKPNGDPSMWSWFSPGVSIIRQLGLIAAISPMFHRVHLG